MTDEVTMEAELPLDTAGARLLRAREAAGLTLKQVSETTKIPERHLVALERGNYASLPARTYATGFGRSYARAVGVDEDVIVAAVRSELDSAAIEPPRRAIQTFEPGDPSRLPSSTLAWIAGLLALVLAVAALFWWRNGSGASAELPSILPEATASATATQAAAPAAAAGEAVVFTALAPDLWVKFYDGNGVQLLQKQLAQGESYTVPADLPQVLLWTARPEALAITVGGQPVAKLSDVQQMVKDVPVTAAALLSRGTAGPGPAPATTAAPAASGTPVAARPRVQPASARASQPERRAPVALPLASPAAEDHSAHSPAAEVPAPTPAAT